MMGKTTLTFVCCQVFLLIVFPALLNIEAQLVEESNPLLKPVQPISYYGIIDKEYNLIVNNETEYLIEFDNPTAVSSSSPAHITVESDDAPNDHPVLIVLRQAKGVLSWQIPFIVGDSKFMKTSRILCPDVNYYETQNVSKKKLQYVVKEDNTFYVSISSGSPGDLHVRMIVTTFKNFTVSVNTEYQVPPPNMDFTPSQPWYFQFKWPQNTTLPDGNSTAYNMKSIVLKVESDDQICITMSIQSLSCPVLDLERTVGYEGFRQTMDKKGGVTLTKDEYPNGFHIVFVVNGDDRKCYDKAYFFLAKEERSKNLKFDVYETISLETFIVAIMAPFVVLTSISFLFAIAAVVYCCRPYNVDRTPPSASSINKTFSQEELPGPSSKLTSDLEECEAKSDGNVSDGTEADSVAGSVEGIIRTGDPTVLVVRSLADLSRKNPQKLRQRSDLYTYNLITVAVFYALPVFQLMYSSQSILQKTGNQDTCFYNFLCAYPQRITATIVISDFNHVFSNLGYIWLGLLFVFWTLRRDTMHQSAVAGCPEFDKSWGIPQHYGLFYALGIALMMEGFLSGMYHVCPNETNFQFDTSFMYVIAVLCMVKLYQNRHPDINASAYTTFLILAFIIFIGMIGIMENSNNFFIVFSVVHVVMCLWISIQVYRMRPLSLGKVIRGINRESCREVLRHPRRSITPTYPSRLGLIIVGNIANWMLVYLGEAYLLKRNFGSYLLNVLLVNLVLYFAFYIAMKVIWRERVTLEPFVYIVLSTILWGWSGYFFLSRVTSWTSTPAGSRHNNEVCNFLHFYDNHDIWHFLSAGSMFCTFMVLLTLDDDLVRTDRNRIHVF